MKRNQKTTALIGGCVTLGLAFLSTAAARDTDPDAKDSNGRRHLALAQDALTNAAAANAQASTKAAEQKALEFIDEHQPKLKKLMEFLKSKQPESYQQALKELGRSQQRLENLEKRDLELYRIELDLWVVRSRLRLLAAEMSVAKAKDTTDRTKELTELIEQESGLELQRLQLLHDRASQQVLTLDEAIAKHRAERDQRVAKSLKVWQNKIKKQSASKSQD